MVGTNNGHSLLAKELLEQIMEFADCIRENDGIIRMAISCV
jgi:hypothetical protein